jgi:hypothetical protein
LNSCSIRARLRRLRKASEGRGFRDCVKTAEGHAFMRARELLSTRPALVAEGLTLRA